MVGAKPAPNAGVDDVANFRRLSSQPQATAELELVRNVDKTRTKDSQQKKGTVKAKKEPEQGLQKEQ